MIAWILQIGEPLPISPDSKRMRSGLLAFKLAQRGHSVVWWTSAFEHQRKKMLYDQDTSIELDKNLIIKIIKGIGYKKNVSIKRYVDHRIIAKKFAKYVNRMQPPDIIVASLPNYDMAYEAQKYAMRYGVPLVVDVRDQWPDLFLNEVPRSVRWLAKLILKKDDDAVRELLEEATGVTSMMERLLEWVYLKTKRVRSENDRVFYLGGDRILENKQGSKGIREEIRVLCKLMQTKFSVIYVGTFNRFYNPMILVEVAKNMSRQSKYSDILFVIAGDGENRRDVQNYSSGDQNVQMTGWINNDEMNELLKAGTVGVCPCGADIEAFPNKIFSYLSAGLPIISSVGGELKEVVQRENIGLYYNCNDAASLFKCIETIYNDRVFLETCSRNVKSVFNAKYNSDMIYDSYAKYLECIVEKKASFTGEAGSRGKAIV